MEMTEYISFDPRVEVSGAVLHAWIAGTQQKIMPYLDAHRVGEVTDAGWYLLQPALDALKEFGQDYPLFNAGLLIPEHATFPATIEPTLSGIFSALDTAYHINHRSGEIGHYYFKKVGERAIDIRAENPYPCEFDFGLVYCLAKRFAPEGVQIEVEHDQQAPCRRAGSHSCLYHVQW